MVENVGCGKLRYNSPEVVCLVTFLSLFLGKGGCRNHGLVGVESTYQAYMVEVSDSCK